jgi:hypothetical protein
MKARSWLTATVLAALLAPGVARGEGVQGLFSIEAQVGTQSEISGDFLKGAEGTLINKAATIDSKRYRDVFAPDVRLQGQLGYGIAERVEIIARGTWYQADATPLKVGTWNGSDVFGYFDAYEEAGFEVGLRYYIAAAGRLKSFIGPVAGARFTKEILVSFQIPDAGSAVLNVPFSQKATVPVFGLDLGFTFALGSHLFLGVDTGLRYQTAPPQFDALPGLTGIDDSDNRWSAPVVASVGVRF